jgi:hypothetical protein
MLAQHGFNEKSLVLFPRNRKKMRTDFSSRNSELRAVLSNRNSMSQENLHSLVVTFNKYGERNLNYYVLFRHTTSLQICSVRSIVEM